MPNNSNMAKHHPHLGKDSDEHGADLQASKPKQVKGTTQHGAQYAAYSVLACPITPRHFVLPTFSLSISGSAGAATATDVGLAEASAAAPCPALSQRKPSTKQARTLHLLLVKHWMAMVCTMLE